MESPVSSSPGAVFFTKEDFLANLPENFELQDNGRIKFDPEKVNVYSTPGGLFIGSSRVAKVDDYEELQNLKNRILTQPIYTEVQIRKWGYFKNWKPHVAVINLGHPDVYKQFKERLEKADKLASEGKNFSLQVEFGQALVTWYVSHTKTLVGMIKGSFWITNFSRRYENLYNMTIFVGILPLLIIGGYYIYRASKSKDMHAHLSDIPLEWGVNKETQ